MDRTEAIVKIVAAIAGGAVARNGYVDISKVEHETKRIMELLEIQMGYDFED